MLKKSVNFNEYEIEENVGGNSVKMPRVRMSLQLHEPWRLSWKKHFHTYPQRLEKQALYEAQVQQEREERQKLMEEEKRRQRRNARKRTRYRKQKERQRKRAK